MSHSQIRNKDSSTIPRISEREWEILKPLWEKGPLAARDLYEKMPEEYNWAYRTVKTMLARLVKKGLITYTPVGNSYLYHAAYSRREVTRSALSSFIRRVFNGTCTPFLAHFVEHMSAEEIQQFKEELLKTERKKRSSQVPSNL